MDYKFITILIVLLGIVLFLMKEWDNVKKNIDDKMNQIVTCIDDNSKMLKNKMQADLTVCVGKIKTINGEYIERVRKMNEYGSQPITNISNNYTDTDSHDNKENNIQYLSDIRKAPKKQTSQIKESSYYMSDDVPKHTKKQKTTEEPKKEQPTDQKPKDNFKITYSDSNKKVDPKDPNAENILTKFVEKIELHNQIIPKQLTGSPSSHSSKKSSHKNAKSDSDLIENDDDVHISDIEDENDSSSCESETDSVGSQYEDENETSSKSTSSSGSQNSGSSGISIEMESPKLKSSKSSKSSESEHSSNYGTITLGSRKTGVKASSKIEMKTSKNADKNMDMESVSSSLNIESLKPIAKYTAESLQKIAKKLSISIFRNDSGNARKVHNKNELYEKIKARLIENEQSKSE